MSRKKDLAEQAVTQYSALQMAAKAAESLHPALTRMLDAGLAQLATKAEAEYRAAVQRRDADFEKVRQDTILNLQKAVKAAGIGVVPWSAAEWQTYAPPTIGAPPTSVRLGELRPTHLTTPLPSMPALLPLVGQRNILISYDSSQSRPGAEILQALTWRIVAQTAPGVYRLILLDPLDRGANLASLLKLPEEIRGLKIYCQDDEIESALKQLAGDIEEVNQRRLLNTYPDIEAYNRANPKVAIPYRFLVLTGFPKGFTPKAGELLTDIARTGRRAGCYLLAGILQGSQLPHGFDTASLMNAATMVTVRDNQHCEWNDPDLAQVGIQPDASPPGALIDRLAKAIQPIAVASAASNIPFQSIAVRKANWWQASSADGLVVPIGLDESGRVFQLTLGRGMTHHALVGGATGTGKTNLLHLLILMLSTTYSPQELELYLVDFKEGVEFQDYVTRSLPHAKAVVLEAEREFGLSMLQRLVEEMERRSQDFKAVGVSDLPEYRRRTGKTMSRILLVMDEYVVLFSEDDRLSFQASEALGALVMRGRSFGIHILLSAQRPASTFLSMTQIKSQMGLRIALKCRPDDSTLILGEGNEKAAKLVQAGEACVTSDPDRIDATARIRIARLEPSDRTLYLGGLREFAQLQHYARPSEMIVFSRDAQAAWLKSPAIARRLTSPAWISLPTPQFWLGQPLRITGDLTVELASEQGANLLVLGSDAGLASRLLISSVLGLTISVAPDQGRFLFIGTPDLQQPSGAIWTTIGTAKSHAIEMTSRQAAVDAVGVLTSELDARLNGLPVPASKRIFLVLAGLHQWHEARGPNAYTPSPAGESLNRVLQQGPLVGIHILAWCDRLNTLGSVIGMGSAQDALAHFNHRVAMQTTQDESVNFIGVPHAGKLGSERAYYRSERWAADELEKFKPFALPSVAETTSITSAAKAHWAKP